MRHLVARPLIAFALAAALAGLPGPALAATSPVNDELAGATPVAVPGGVENQDTDGATASPSDPRTCWTGYTVWFEAVAQQTGVLRVDAIASVLVPPEDGSGFPIQRDLSTGLTVFTGAPGALVERGCSAPTFLGGAQVDAPVRAGERVLVMAGALEPSRNSLMTLSLRHVRAPAVDVTVDRTGTVTADGVATVTGTLRCDVDGTLVDVSLSLRQRSPHGPAAANATSVACTTSGVAWSLDLTADVGADRLRPGRAAVVGVVAAGEPGLRTEVPVSASVVLRPARPCPAAG